MAENHRVENQANLKNIGMTCSLQCNKEEENTIEVSETDSDSLRRQLSKFSIAEFPAVPKNNDSNQAYPAECYVPNVSGQSFIVEEVEPKPPEPFENPFN